MSNLQTKSEILQKVAQFLNTRGDYPAVAHSAYYSCYQLLKHIWLHSMGKTENELNFGINNSRIGSHDFLINKTVLFIDNSGKADCRNHARDIRNKITQLKKLRTDADYSDTAFDSLKSSNSISLSGEIVPILKKY